MTQVVPDKSSHYKNVEVGDFQNAESERGIQNRWLAMMMGAFPASRQRPRDYPRAFTRYVQV
jgi:hypothetical protein